MDSHERLLKVTVRDTGTGIAPKDIPKLFTRFGKLQRTAAINSEGLGLGLTIVKQIIELYGGSIDVQSEGLGKGSEFSFKLLLDSVNADY